MEDSLDKQATIDTLVDNPRYQQRLTCSDKELAMFKGLLQNPLQMAYIKFWYFHATRQGRVPLWFKDQHEQEVPFDDILCPSDRPGGLTEDEKERYILRTPKVH